MNPDNKGEMTQVKSPGVRYLSFVLGSEEYAIPLLAVKEVIAVPEITPIPFTPTYFLGLMNLRGQVISVIDLRKKLAIKSSGNTETAIIICELPSVCVGIVVDSINSVFFPNVSDLSEKPEIQSSVGTEYITGVYRKEGHLIVMLELGKLLSFEDHKVISTSAKAKQAE